MTKNVKNDIQDQNIAEKIISTVVGLFPFYKNCLYQTIKDN